MVASLSVRLRRHSKAVHEYRQRGLTLPSRGRPTSGFASCRPPLMSNVRPPNMHPLETAVLEWIATHHPAMKYAVLAQASEAKVIARTYTNGGGVFVELEIPAGTLSKPNSG